MITPGAAQNDEDPKPIGNPYIHLLADLLGRHLGDYADVEVELNLKDADGNKTTVSVENLHEKLDGDPDFVQSFERLAAGFSKIKVTILADESLDDDDRQFIADDLKEDPDETGGE